jgi:hypothetical protein
VREHLIFTPKGNIAFVQQIPGNRHDSQGLYALLKTTFTGALIADNAYWPNSHKCAQLEQQGIRVTAATRSNWKFQHPPKIKKLLKTHRPKIERRIGLYDRQFHAQQTLCRSRQHYEARRWIKALAHNISRRINAQAHLPKESVAHFRRAA